MRLNLKCLEGEDTARLTWHWAIGVEQVLIFPEEKLYTLQEYKNFGGYVVKKKPGIFTYRISPYLDGELVDAEENEVEFVCKTDIDYLVTAKNGFFELALFSDFDVAADVICYAKNEQFTYYFGENLIADEPIMRTVLATGNEQLRVFISEQNSALYTLNKCDKISHGGIKIWDFLNGKKRR